MQVLGLYPGGVLRPRLENRCRGRRRPDSQTTVGGGSSWAPLVYIYDSAQIQWLSGCSRVGAWAQGQGPGLATHDDF